MDEFGEGHASAGSLLSQTAGLFFFQLFFSVMIPL